MAARKLSGRGVAQPGSAPQWGCGGREFESPRPDHFGTVYSGHMVYTYRRNIPQTIGNAGLTAATAAVLDRSLISVDANGRVLSVRNIPGTGCVFTIDLPRQAAAKQRVERSLLAG